MGVYLETPETPGWFGLLYFPNLPWGRCPPAVRSPDFGVDDWFDPAPPPTVTVVKGQGLKNHEKPYPQIPSDVSWGVEH